ncbi:hypothetical protein ACWDYH_21510 [Nocardia goodfellowii]
MSTSPDRQNDNLRSEVAQQLVGWDTVLHCDITKLIAGDASRLSRVVHGRSCVDPSVEIVAQFGSRPVEDDGTFTSSGSIYLVSLLIAVDPALTDQSEVGVTYAESTAWLTALFPHIDRFYVRENPASESKLTSRQWFFSLFIGHGVGLVSAPLNFDWVAHRIRYRGLLVSLIDRDGTRLETIYKNERFADFYLPYTERRGRYWDIEILSPRRRRVFHAASKALPRQ